MNTNLPDFTRENLELNSRLEQLHLEFVDLFTCHKDMVENESDVLTSLYLENLGNLQLELLRKQTEAARLKLKMNLIQAAINRDETPDLFAIENYVDSQMKEYYARIEAQAAALDDAREVLSHLIPPDEVQKLKELFRILCKRLHPDLNPGQTEEEKELFIKAKAAYELKRLADLQSILLYLDDAKKEKLTLISYDEKKERIKQLEKSIAELNEKIDQLNQTFPFSIRELIFDEEYISLKQGELKSQIEIAGEEIAKYANIIDIMTNE